LFGELIQAFTPWEPVADVIDAMPDGPPEDVIPAVAHAVADALTGRVGLLLRTVFELTQGDPDTTEGMRHSIARGLPNLVGYLNNQMQEGRLRRMHPILAFQLLAGPIVVHFLTRSLAESRWISANRRLSYSTRSCRRGFGPWRRADTAASSAETAERGDDLTDDLAQE
jgi:hypothetical protein